MLIERDQKRNRTLLISGEPRDEIRNKPAHRLRREVSGKVCAQVVRIGEREFLGIGLDKEIERIDHRHVGGEIDFDAEFVGRLRKDEARQPVAVRILLPVDEVLGRRNLQRIARYRRAAMRRRPQPDDLGSQCYRPIVFVGRDVMKRDED